MQTVADKITATILADLSDLEERFQALTHDLIMVHISADFANGLQTWCEDMRSSGASQLVLDPPGGARDADAPPESPEQADKRMMDLVAPALSSVQLEHCSMFHKAHTTFCDTVKGNLTALESSPLWRDVKANITEHTEVLNKSFSVVVPEDFSTLMYQHLGTEADKEMCETSRICVRKALPMMN